MTTTAGGRTGGTGDSPVPAVSAALLIKRRNLPHWQSGGSTYFITHRCKTGVELNDSDKSIVLDNCRYRHKRRYFLHTAVVMPDHVHVLITPSISKPDSWIGLQEILHTNKSFTAHAINTAGCHSGRIWQDERYDRIVRDEAEFREKWTYIANNPQEAGLVTEWEVYPWPTRILKNANSNWHRPAA